MWKKTKKCWAWRCGSVTQDSPSMGEAPGSSPALKKKKRLLPE
jgi:hypothetical protein